MKDIYEIAQIIYDAKKEDAWGNWQSEYRGKWPETGKELRTRLHHGDTSLEFAIAQAKAVKKYLTKEKENETSN